MSDVKGRFKKSVSRSEVSSSSSSTSSFSSDDESDSDGDLKPIKDYMCNRKEVARQLFKSVKIEKIRMMLPQVLKKMELGELEEWCASELAGMSKTRILSILNGTPMSGSSDTSDSDDSGPSLEIISDTEEWLTDDEPNVKQEPLSPSSRTKKLKAKRKTKTSKNEADKGKGRKGKSRINPETKNVKVKTEKDKSDTKNQEGESLLDLLELEMRARAIRALIRKEEDIIPTLESDQKKNSNINALKSTLNSVKNNRKKTTTSENSQTSIETSETLVEKIGEDEDVVLLVRPTPTIEVISSDSEPENPNGRVNKRLENERTPEKSEEQNKTPNECAVTTEGNGSEIPKVVVTNEPSSEGVTDSKLDESVVDKGDDKITSVTSKESSDSGKQTFRKLKRRSHLRTKSKSLSECIETTNIITEVVNEEVKQAQTIEEKITHEEKVNEEVSKVEEDVVIKKIITLNEDKFGDYEEIIDLDDYPDDMYDMETDDNNVITESKSNEIIEGPKADTIEDAREDDNSAETWATRYYQTDSVQNVIKESKIQSEIRKRLRERQRLSKLNNSPKESPKVNADSNEIKPKPTGSVNEYFALKGTATIIDKSSLESSETKNNQINEEPLSASQEEVDVPISVASTSLEKASTNETNESSTVPKINKS